MHDDHNHLPTSLAIFEDASEERAFLFPYGLETSMESYSGEAGKHNSECVLVVLLIGLFRNTYRNGLE